MAAIRRPIIVGNWKCNKTVSEAVELATAVRHVAGPLHYIDIGIAPPFTALWPVSRPIRESKLMLVAQNCHYEDAGPYTGEVSAPILADIGCRYILVGHSERRTLFGETDEIVNKKVKAVIRNNIGAILCVGETLEEREGDKAFDVIKRQLEVGLAGIEEGQAKKLTLAYEPVWAIGTGKVASNAQAQEVHQFIRKFLVDAYADVGDHVRIMYGGSVTPDNIAGLMDQPEIDGALVGGASLKAETFIDILKYSS